MSDLLWIAVPDGLRPSSQASIRVLVVPQLTAGTIGEFGLGSAGCAGRGTGGRRTLLVAAADPPSPPSRPRTPFAVALVGP